MAFIEGCPHVRGGLYEGLHCNNKKINDTHNFLVGFLSLNYVECTVGLFGEYLAE